LDFEVAPEARFCGNQAAADKGAWRSGGIRSGDMDYVRRARRPEFYSTHKTRTRTKPD
jgi:hypothetical protein